MASHDDALQQAPADTNAKLGQLADTTPDTMTLHTQDAYRMFTGRPADAEGHASQIVGGRRFAAVLKSMVRESVYGS